MKNSITLFGIPNCDTVKKARTWLEQESISFTFHNFKKDGLKQAQVEVWLQKIDLERLINRKGTTWRNLPETTKNNVTERNAVELAIGNPSIIKRPLVTSGEKILLGFSEEDFKDVF